MAPAQMIEIKDLPYDLVHGGSQSLPGATETTRSAFVGEPSYGGEPYGVAPAAEVHALAGGTAAGASATAGWERALAGEAKAMLEEGERDVLRQLTARLERAVISAALAQTRGRRIEAAQKLGIGRNTITRKLQELGFD
jgi:two-component system nitrogen regulation response regulator GlnG